MTVDKRFALIADNGDVLYPYQKEQRSTGRFGFALSTGTNTDKHGGGEYTTDIEQVVQRVVLGRWRVRVKTESGQRSGSMGLEKRVIHGYWVAPELRHLVASAALRPLANLPGEPVAATSKPPMAASQPPAARDEAVEAWDAIGRLGMADYQSALGAIEPGMTTAQRAMLLGHASAALRRLSMLELAQLGRYSDARTANIQYGALGRKFADFFGVHGLENQTQAVANSTGAPDASGHWVWELRQPLFDALVAFGLVDVPIESFGAVEAAAQVDADPQCQDLSPTQRLALVNARIGQGGYRQRMLRLWGGRCAVTACRTPCALIASHALSWADSTNEQRLDEFNGLLLTASIDKLFDNGLISFSAAGCLLVDSSLVDEDLGAVGLSRASCIRKLDSRHLPYLAAHRVASGFAS